MVIVAQLGARMHYAVPAILEGAGLLERLYTDICAPRRLRPFLKVAAQVGPASLRRWLGRIPAGVPSEKIISFNAMAFEYYKRRNEATPGALTAANLWVGPQFCRRVIQCGLGNASSVFTYNGAGLELLQHARAAGVRTVMEQTIACAEIEDKLIEAEETDYSRWELPRAKDPFRSAFSQREQAEWEVADVILCGSEFVRESIRASRGPVERCRVVPYGVRLPPGIKPRERRRSPLRVLTVGAVGLRKGAPYVLEVARTLGKRAEFRMAGQLDISSDAQKVLSSHVMLLGSVPRSEVRQQFEWADVFLLPTLCEGSATVCYEALSYGLPVITTPNAGSVVRDEIDGFIVPIRDGAAIVDRIERFLDDGDLWETMSRNALKRSAEYTVERYGERFVNALQAVPSMVS
ncbi:MAG: glycosyltransferase family 4 protein [Terracidiphilus sp.]